MQHLANYRKELVRSMTWYDANKSSERIINGKNYIIINAKQNILPTMIGTLASMISKSRDLKPGTFVLSMARQQNNTTKVSLRRAGYENDDLASLISQISQAVDGQAGGHINAAGAIIRTEKEEEFISSAIKALGRFTP